MAEKPQPPSGPGEHDAAMIAPTVEQHRYHPPDAAAGAAHDSAALELPVGSQVGRYVVLRRLGEGGMGIVYAAYDAELDRKVALKLLRQSGPGDADRRARLLREAQAMARIAHPNVVGVFEVGEVAGRVFVAMEFVDGTTLTEWQTRGRTWGEVLEIYAAAGRGLLAAHHAGLVHRDFKPDNVLVGADGRPRVADFGLARGGPKEDPAPSPVPAEALSSSAQLLNSPLTLTGAILGTPMYMSPEQHQGQSTDVRSDQWSFCAALYEALFKLQPFAGETMLTLSFNVLAGRLRPVPQGSAVPARIAKVLRRGLSVAAEDRYPSMAELLSALAVDPKRDPSVAPLARRLFIWVVLAVVAANTVYLNLAARRGTMDVRDMLLASILLLCGSLGVAWSLRRSLLSNSFHRGLITLVIILFAQMVGVRGLGLMMGLGLPQVMVMDLFCTSAIAAVISALYLPGGWPVVVLGVVAAVGKAAVPQSKVPLMVYPVLAIVFGLLWSRAANQRARKAS